MGANFHLVTANVSSIAVWIRLNELLIEYYHAEALHQIGKTIGNVLRVDTHTASETRGRFARLCVQVDVNKPLATTILIGKFEQPICYEGIHKLCFVCGRMGHTQEFYPQVVRQDLPSKKAETVAEGERELGACNERVADNDKSVQGPTESVLANEQKGGTNGRYRLWVVVMRKKNGTKSQRSGGVSMVQGSSQPQQCQKRSESVLRTNFVPRQTESRSVTAREAKRKSDGSAGNSFIQNFVNEPNRRAQDRIESSPKFKELDLANIRFIVDLSKPNPSYKSSVKGMKVLARLRASQSLMMRAGGEDISACPQSTILSHEHEFHDASTSRSNYGGHQIAFTSQFQFTIGQQAMVGQFLRGNGSHDGTGDGSHNSTDDGKPKFTTNQQAMMGQVL